MKDNIKQRKYSQPKYAINKNSIFLNIRNPYYLKFGKYLSQDLFDIKSTYHE